MELTYDEGLAFGKDPCWSPDGARIAFVAQRAFDQDEIFIMAAEPGAAAFQVTNFRSRQLHDLDWSPDGSRIVCTVVGGDTPENATYTLKTVSAAGGPLTRLAGGDPGQFPAWSPDGTRIAFASNRSGNHEIYVVDAGGGEPVRLTDDPAQDYAPTWSPDGSEIAFVSDRGGGFHLWVMASDGLGPTQVTFGLVDEGSPSWAPEGDRIAFIRATQARVWDIYLLAGRATARPQASRIASERP